MRHAGPPPRACSSCRQSGFALIELSLALLIGTLLLVWGTAQLMRHAEDVAAEAAGAWLLEIRNATQHMIERHFDRLSLGDVPADESGQALFAEASAPTLGEFKTQGLLPAAFPENSPLGGTASIRLAPTGCPGSACRVDAMIYAARPLLDSLGVPDMMRMALLVEASGGYGGHATAGRDSRLRGKLFDFSNPFASGAPVLPAGTPVLWAGMDLATAAQYVRRHDERDPELKSTLTVAGRMHGGEYLYLDGMANPGGACESDGLIGRSSAGAVLSCQLGIWRRHVLADGDTMGGTLGVATNAWSMVGFDAAGNANAAAQNPAGSVNINDAYVRSVGRWLSQINFDGYAGPAGPQGPQGPAGAPGAPGPAGTSSPPRIFTVESAWNRWGSCALGSCYAYASVSCPTGATMISAAGQCDGQNCVVTNTTSGDARGYSSSNWGEGIMVQAVCYEN
jgi:prepilin-type N-terminal cleavage/methylation domain-containing protein